MPISIICPSCGNKINAPDRVAGRTLRCFQCLNPFAVPKVSPAAIPSFDAPAAVPLPAAPIDSPVPSFDAPPPVPSFDAPPPVPPSASASSGPDPFELTQEESTWDAPPPAAPPEELPSTQDMPLEEAAMELAPTDEFEAPADETPPEVPEEPVGPRKSRMVAALLGIFLPFGVHRFYLGFTKIGLLQLVLAPCGGIGTLWAWIEGVLLLLGKGTRIDGRGMPLR